MSRLDNLTDRASSGAGRITSWVQALSHISPQNGGIALSVPQLASATEAEGLQRCPIASFCSKEEVEVAQTIPGLCLETFPADRTSWMNGRHRERLKDIIRASNGVHIHGIWETHCMAAAWAARSTKRPYIISSHGMLDSWALQQKRFKKALYAALVETRTLRQAACLRALTVDEVDDYRRLGLMNPIAIVPNGIGLPVGVNADMFWKTYPQLSGKRIVLFMGRLHRKKGLDLLVQAWAKLKRQADDAHLVIAGPDSENMRTLLEQMATELKLRSSITFVGMLTGDDKWSALAAAKLFVLPSHSEGFSVAVLEALAMGIPVVVTVPCHVPEVADHDCGWVIPAAAINGLEGALEDFLRLSPAEATRMGERGKVLVHRRFHWSVVGKQMAEVYQWLQGGSKPTSAEIA